MSLAPASPSGIPVPPTADSGAPARDERRRVGLLVLCGLALIVGVTTGFGAVGLRALIGLFHNAFYNGTFSIWYDANISEGPSRFGNWVVLSPILGGLAKTGRPTTYSYAYPEPEGFGSAPLRPPGARYDSALREFVLPYDALRKADNPEEELLAFLQSTYEAAANLGHWDRRALEATPPQ